MVVLSGLLGIDRNFMKILGDEAEKLGRPRRSRDRMGVAANLLTFSETLISNSTIG